MRDGFIVENRYEGTTKQLIKYHTPIPLYYFFSRLQTQTQIFEKTLKIKTHTKKFFEQKVFPIQFSSFFILFIFLVKLIVSSEKLLKFGVLVMKSVLYVT